MQESFQDNSVHHKIREIKKLFFTYRNGMLSDTLRGYGDPHKIIFGLEVPRLAEIARQYAPDKELAETLWNDYEVRESRLLATYLFAPEETTPETALKLAASVRTREEADMLAFRLFKRMENPESLLNLINEDIERNQDEKKSLVTAYSALRQHIRR